MRIGVNPEKAKEKLIRYKPHRIIIPVYIPDTDDKYFLNLFLIFKKCIHSLLNSIDADFSAITIINNDCREDVTNYIDELLCFKKIDKHVKYHKNMGKVNSILAEARASFEDYITITDADVFFMNNWEKEVFRIFNLFPKVGVVSPVPSPHSSFYCNKSLFGSFFLKIKKGNIVTEKAFNLFQEGVNPPKGFFVNKNHNWLKSQYYIKKNNVIACVGAGHFVATYKREVFSNIPFIKPFYVFKNGDETAFIDKFIDRQNYWRVSTTEVYAYHMGNTIEKWVDNYKFDKTEVEYNLNSMPQKHRLTLKYGFYAFIFKVLKGTKLL